MIISTAAKRVQDMDSLLFLVRIRSNAFIGLSEIHAQG